MSAGAKAERGVGVLSLLVAQRFNRIDAGGLHGGIDRAKFNVESDSLL